MSLDIIRIRRDTFANWDSENPTLSLGEISYDLTNKQIRVGDGSTAWLDLQPIGNSTLADGDYGDIVVGSGGTTINLDSTLMTTINNKLNQGPLDGGSPTSVGQVLRIRKGATASWSGVVLSSGEIGYDTTLKELKIGDGTTVWGSLPTIGATATSINLNALTDVTISAPTTGQTLIFSAGQWSNQTAPTPVLPINSLSDVVITAPQNTQLLQFNGTNWVNSFPVTTEPLVTAGEKNHINVVGVDTDWRIVDDVVTQDMLALTSPVNPEDAATKGYADSTIGMAITAAVTEKLDQASGIAVLNSSRLVDTVRLGTGTASSSNFLRGDGTWNSVTITPEQIANESITSQKLKWNTREVDHDRKIVRHLYTDGTSLGSWVFSKGTAAAPTQGSYAIVNDTIVLTTQASITNCTVRVRDYDRSFGFIDAIMTLRDCPKKLRANVKYDGSANSGTFAFVGFFGTHALVSDTLCCFTCNGTSTWRAQVTIGGVSLLDVDTGLSVDTFRNLEVEVYKEGVLFNEIVFDSFGDPNSFLKASWTWTTAGYTLYEDAIDPCYGGVELRERVSGASQNLSVKEMWLQESLGYKAFAELSHTHTLADISQSAATTGQVPTWDGSAWTPATPTGGGGGGITDGDKGDIVVSDSGATWTIETNAITTSKILNTAVTAAKLAAGAVTLNKMANNSVGVNQLVPTGELDGTIYYTTNDGAFTGVLGFSPTFVVTEGSFPAQLNLADQSVTYAKIQNVSATDKLLGRSTAGAGVVEEIACTAAGRALIDDATASDQRTTLGLGTMATQNASSVAITGGTLSGTTVTTGAFSSPTNEATMRLVRKDTAGTITKGQVVRMVGSTGTHLTVELADASSENTAKTSIGIAVENITNSTSGYMMISGELTGLSNVPSSGGTENFVDGSLLWLSETTGAFTQTRPTQPAHGVVVGWVVSSSNGSNGRIYVKVDNGQELDEIHDVLIATPAAGHLLTRNAANTLWENKFLTDASIASNTISGTKLSDTTVAVGKINATGTPGSGNFLRGDGQWATPTAGAPTDATYIVQTASSGLSSEQALGSLTTGILKNTATTGVLSIATGSDLPTHTHAASDIISGVIATARLGTGTQDTTTFLRGDGTWQSVSGSGMTFQQSLRIAALL